MLGVEVDGHLVEVEVRLQCVDDGHALGVGGRGPVERLLLRVEGVNLRHRHSRVSSQIIIIPLLNIALNINQSASH